MMKLCERFSQIEFSEELNFFLDEYRRAVAETEMIQPRDDNIWSWLYEASRLLVYNTVPRELRKDLYSTQVIGIILCIVMDDIADMLSEEQVFDLAWQSMGDRQVAAGLPEHLAQYRSLLLLVNDLWSHLEEKFREWPHSGILADEIANGYRCYWQTLRDSATVNRLIRNQDSIVDWDFDRYLEWMKPGAYTGLYGMLTLQVVAQIFPGELDTIKEILEEAEGYVVMGNWLATWADEIPEKDFTSGVVIWALDNGVITLEQLNSEDSHWIVGTIENSSFRKDFAQRMEDILMRLEFNYPAIQTFSLREYIDILRTLYGLQRGHSDILKYAQNEAS